MYNSFILHLISLFSCLCFLFPLFLLLFCVLRLRSPRVRPAHLSRRINKSSSPNSTIRLPPYHTVTHVVSTMASEKRKRLDLGDESVSKKQFTAGAAAAAAGGNPTINPLTGRPFSPNYWKIFETRKGLPVYAQREEFRAMLASTQCMILVGETGSGYETPPNTTEHTTTTHDHNTTQQHTNRERASDTMHGNGGNSTYVSTCVCVCLLCVFVLFLAARPTSSSVIIVIVVVQ